jgi:hypothetical protein
MNTSLRESLDQALTALSDVQKLELIEKLARSLRIHEAPDVEQKQNSLSMLRRELASLPTADLADGFSNRDHDRLLYGAKA